MFVFSSCASCCPTLVFKKERVFGFFFFFFFCSFFRKFLLERWAARSKRCVLLFRVCRAERRSPRSILAHAQASCWHTHTPCSHARVLGCRSSHEVYLLMLRQAAGTHAMQSYSSSQLVPTPSRADAYPMHKLYQHTGGPMNIADRLWRHADRLWACRRLREAEACLLSCLRVSDTNIHHVSYETKEAV